MKKHTRAFTYEEKIPDVRNGKCKQTIRFSQGTEVGDEILFHGWKGRPQFSEWTWRLRELLREALDIVGGMMWWSK